MEKTTFVCRNGTFQSKIMLFGLMNTSTAFQRMMDGLLGSLILAQVYLDDVMKFSSNLEGRVRHIQQLVALAADYGLNIKMNRCEVTMQQADLHEQIVDKNRVKVDPGRVDIISNPPHPTNQTELRGFLGILGYSRQFNIAFGAIYVSPHAETSAKDKIEWTRKLKEAH